MCGIAGFCLNPKEHKRVTVSDLTSQMLLDIEHRGQHATGGAWINPVTGKRVIRKAPVTATKFIKASENLGNNAQSCILHTRWATQGSPKDNNNNHPIPHGRIVLTHNGHIANDNELFKQLKVKRNGLVDSEAVTALIAHSKAPVTEVLEQVQGTAALAWLESDAPNVLHLARLNSSPLWIGLTVGGSLVYGSTEDTIENASIIIGSDLDWKYRASEGEYFKVKDGVIAEYSQFKPYKNTRDWSWETMSARTHKRNTSYDSYWQEQEELAF
jgi:glucosamine--fructose-6-phosphate aminotransferase (isomerizing)